MGVGWLGRAAQGRQGDSRGQFEHGRIRAAGGSELSSRCGELGERPRRSTRSARRRFPGPPRRLLRRPNERKRRSAYAPRSAPVPNPLASRPWEAPLTTRPLGSLPCADDARAASPLTRTRVASPLRFPRTDARSWPSGQTRRPRIPDIPRPIGAADGFVRHPPWRRYGRRSGKPRDLTGEHRCNS